MGEEFRLQEPLFIWEEVSGKTIGNITKPLQVKNRILYVQVPNHTIQHELTLLREGYIEKINQKLGRDELKDIKFKVGYTTDDRSDYDNKTDLANIHLSDREKEELNDIVGGLGHDSLKESLLGFFTQFKKMEKARERLGWDRCERCGVYHKSGGAICPACESELG